LQNRVTPLGEIIADPARGLVYGNRGCLHDAEGRIRRPFNGRRWIACRLEFKGRRRRPLVRPGRYTSLFFLDEVTAFAAGHRPCAECRREDYVRFLDRWRVGHPDAIGADDIDAVLHAERLNERSQRHHEAPLDEQPDGTFVLLHGAPHLVAGETVWRWTPRGYADGEPRKARLSVEVITPSSLVEILRPGWMSSVPFIHPSARG
jgi:hypothetical protein